MSKNNGKISRIDDIQDKINEKKIENKKYHTNIDIRLSYLKMLVMAVSLKFSFVLCEKLKRGAQLSPILK